MLRISAPHKDTNQYVSVFFLVLLKSLNNSTMPGRSSRCTAIIYTLWHVAGLFDELLYISFDNTRDWTSAHPSFPFNHICLNVSCMHIGCTYLWPDVPAGFGGASESHVWAPPTSVLAEAGERGATYRVAGLLPSPWLLEVFIKKC